MLRAHVCVFLLFFFLRHTVQAADECMKTTRAAGPNKQECGCGSSTCGVAAPFCDKASSSCYETLVDAFVSSDSNCIKTTKKCF